MLNRAHRITSSAKLFQEKFVKLKHIFEQNAYPVQFFDKVYCRFLAKLNKNVVNNSTWEEEKLKCNLKIPFVGKPSVDFGKRVSALMADKFGAEINVIYTSLKVGSFFSLKCHTPLPLLSRVVYKYTCLGDQDTSYIGMTIRTVTERVKEHLEEGVSPKLR